MKKNKTIIYVITVIVIIVLSLFNSNDGKTKVELIRCIDGDSSVLLIDGEEVECRFIAIDAPELATDIGQEVREYTNELLRNANNLYIELDPKSDEYDKFDRYLCWLWVDDELLEEILVRNGYAKVKYIYDDYKYVDKLNELQDIAKEEKLGIWSK